MKIDLEYWWLCTKHNACFAFRERGPFCGDRVLACSDVTIADNCNWVRVNKPTLFDNVYEVEL